MKTRIVALTAVLLLGLTGCAGAGAGGNGDANVQHASTEQTKTPAPSGSSEPLVAEVRDATDADEQFLAEARDRLSGLGSATTVPNATDDQLIEAGHTACEALIAGTPFVDVSVIQEEERVQGSFLDSAAITSAGILYFCPEVNGKTN